MRGTCNYRACHHCEVWAKTVLDGVSFDIYKGRTTALVGESGSGRSTMAQVIAPPAEGEIRFEGKPLEGDFRRRDKEKLRRIQMIYPWRTHDPRDGKSCPTLSAAGRADLETPAPIADRAR
ncbi:ATP-binding cassette domain-containing protein [Mesorhizobium sp. M0977]|uniref:ATP-binding cassette domain-containing protein n=1 Tax=Mesorhizobium sp. M0977 TaxID=2957039 RepID=UPI00333B5614